MAVKRAEGARELGRLRQKTPVDWIRGLGGMDYIS